MVLLVANVDKSEAVSGETPGALEFTVGAAITPEASDEPAS